MSVAARMLAALVAAYRYLLSPVLPAHCRYWPSCSAYALDALREHGAIAGGRLTLLRLARCHPWGGSGIDPVPPRAGADYRQADGRGRPIRTNAD